MERWPKLALCKGDGLAKPRASAVTETNIHQYYSLLEETLQENGILNCPSRVYNMDESGMPLDHKPPKVVVPKGTKVHCRTSGNKAQMWKCSRLYDSPMVNFEGKHLNPEWTKGEVPDTLYGMLEKGWKDMELFHYWMTSLFIPNIPPARPVCCYSMDIPPIMSWTQFVLLKIKECGALSPSTHHARVSAT